MSPFGFGRKSTADANLELLERLAAERVERFAESKHQELQPHERAWFESGAQGASIVAQRLKADRLKEPPARALAELLTMPLISFWHWREDQRNPRSQTDAAEARATDFRHLQVAYSDLRYGVETVRPNAQELLSDALALDWQFGKEMGSTTETMRKSVYEALLAEKAVAILTGTRVPLCGDMGLPVNSVSDLIDRREQRAGLTASIEFTPAIRGALSAAFESLDRKLEEPLVEAS